MQKDCCSDCSHYRSTTHAFRCFTVKAATSERVSEGHVEAIRAEVPELSYGAEVVFDGVALVDMRGRSVGEWEVLDRISLVEPGCDEPIAPTA